jgi:hypothetical protein
VQQPNVQDVEEEREDRRERRADRAEDRQFNQAGVTGFALAVTSLMFVIVANVYKTNEVRFDFWSGMFNCFSIPVTISGFICSLIGALSKRSADKKLATAGVVISGLLLVTMPFYVWGWK